MRVIFFPGPRSGAATRELSGVLLTLLVLLLAVTLLFAGAFIDRYTQQRGPAHAGQTPLVDTVANNAKDREALRQLRGELIDLTHQHDRQRRELADANAQFEREADVMGAHIGQLQAQVVRLNALGARLVALAELPETEFNFSEAPALGGPAEAEDAEQVRGAADVNSGAAMLARLADELSADADRLSALETLIQDRDLKGRLSPTGWPSDGGWLSSAFGSRRDPFTGRLNPHKGVDIANETGAPILAAADGVVTFSGQRSGYGRLVEINHGAGYVTRYAHANTLTANVGDRVSRGQIIATVGRSGRATGPHLHFEVLYRGQHVDPKQLLAAIPTHRG